MRGAAAVERVRSGRPARARHRLRPSVLGLALLALAAAFFIARATNDGSAAAWQPLPRAPVAGRLAEAVAWTGRELIVAGGVTRRADGSAAPATDAAAYDPATQTWRLLAAPTAGIGAGAVWTGRRLVVWTGNGPGGPVAATYDLRNDTWRRLPAGPLGPREGNATVWTGKELLVIGGYSGDGFAAPIAAALDPATGGWRALRGLYGLTLFGGPSGAVWDGRDAIIAGNLSLCPEQGTACGRKRPILVAYNPVADRMRELALPAGVDGAPTPLAWTGSAVVFRAWTAGSLRVLTYRPPDGRWQTGPEAPCTLPHTTDSQTPWIDGRIVAPCAAGGLQLYDVARATWERRAITGTASPLAGRLGSAIAWTGKALVVWSGAAFERFNPTPADGAAVVLR
jgi:hypothetical protein